MTNHITVDGNVTADLTLRHTQSGTPVVNLKFAHTPKKLNKQSGEWEDDGDTLFFTVSLWGDEAENAAESYKQGDFVVATGKLKQRTRTADDGTTYLNLEITPDNVGPSTKRATVAITKNAKNGQKASQSAPQQSKAAEPQKAPAAASAGVSDDGPF